MFSFGFPMAFRCEDLCWGLAMQSHQARVPAIELQLTQLHRALAGHCVPPQRKQRLEKCARWPQGQANIRGLLMESTPMGSARKASKKWDYWIAKNIFVRLCVLLAPGRSESCRRFRDLQKSIVILSNGAVWARHVTLLMKTLPPKKCWSDTWFFGLEEVGDV